MNLLELFRRQTRRTALRNTGIDADHVRVFSAQTMLMGNATEILRLPADTSDSGSLQNPDGTLTFVHGLSAWGGPDTH